MDLHPSDIRPFARRGRNTSRAVRALLAVGLMTAERKERERKKARVSEWRRGSDTYLKPGAMLAQLPVRSQMQYGSREARQALQREEEKKRYNVTVSESVWKHPSIHHNAGSDDCLLYNTAAAGRHTIKGRSGGKEERDKIKCYDEKEQRWNRRDRIKGKESRRVESKRERDEK